jgi:hypothetical protein
MGSGVCGGDAVSSKMNDPVDALARLHGWRVHRWMQMPPHKKATPNPIEHATETDTRVRPVSRFKRYAIPVGVTLALALSATGVGILHASNESEGDHCDRDRRAGFRPFDWVDGFDPLAWIRPTVPPSVRGAMVSVSPIATVPVAGEPGTEETATSGGAVGTAMPSVEPSVPKWTKPTTAPRTTSTGVAVSSATPSSAPSRTLP